MDPMKLEAFNNNKGATMIVALLMLVALSLAVFMALENSLTNSKMMLNSRVYRDLLYNAESGISHAIENHKDTWLDSGSKLFTPTEDFSDPDDAKIIENNVQITDESGGQVKVAEYEIARIEDSPKTGSLSEQLVQLQHNAPPRIGSGYSPKNFEIRRYGIVSTGVSGHTLAQKQSVAIEAGLFKVFNKFSNS